MAPKTPSKGGGKKPFAHVYDRMSTPMRKGQRAPAPAPPGHRGRGSGKVYPRQKGK